MKYYDFCHGVFGGSVCDCRHGLDGSVSTAYKQKYNFSIFGKVNSSRGPCDRGVSRVVLLPSTVTLCSSFEGYLDLVGDVMDT